MGFFTTLALLGALISLTSGNYHFENYKIYKVDSGEEPYRKPWFFEDYASPYSNYKDEGGNFGNAYESVAEQKTPEVYEHPEETYFASNTKRVPNEDKNFKKAISPFYTLTDSDNEKYKSIILKSGAPYCQEIKSQVPKKRFRRDAMTCYKCKDPKNGATYEQCSYTSEPHETTQIDKRVPIPSSLRYRRSNSNGEDGKPLAEIGPQYRFSDEYFTPAESAEVSAEYKKKMENCEKVVKDSMVCMVCKDPATNGKYEQCSYVNKPNDKAYGYSKSSSFGLPQGEKEKEESRPVEKIYSGEQGEDTPARYTGPDSTEFESSHPEVDKYFDEQTAAIKSRAPKQKKNYGEETEESARLESGSETVKDGSCKKIVKDTMVCTVCKDPKTGGNYEQCAYAYNPSDKVYQFSRSKKFGYPEESGEGKKSADYYKAKKDSGRGNFDGDEERAEYNYDQPTENHESQEYAPFKSANSDEVISESEKISEDTKSGDCQKVQKDDMTCMVCKDPKTGGNYEQCSYAYQPNDKVFSFSRAKSFGSPEADGDKESYTGGSGGNAGSDYGESGSYGLASDNKPHVHKASEAVRNPANDEKNLEIGGSKDADKVDVEFFNTAEKKKEIEKVLSEFQQEDRSKCKKVLRDKLTCFQCTGEDGEQKEECLFVADQEPAKDRVTYREVKEFQKDPVAAAGSKISKNYWSDAGLFDDEIKKPVIEGRKKQKRKTKKTDTPKKFYPDSTISASEQQESNVEADDEDSGSKNENYEAESEEYDYGAATKPVYDKALGLTLPRYMLTTSEHEIEFDEVVASSKI